MGGSETVTLTVQQLPAHAHTQQFSSVAATGSALAGNLLAQIGGTDSQENPVLAAAGQELLVACGAARCSNSTWCASTKATSRAGSWRAWVCRWAKC